MWMIHFLLQILFPARCLGCKVSGTPLCTRCTQLSRKSLTPINSYTTSLFDFKDPLIRYAIRSIKYYGRRDLLPPLANALAKQLQENTATQKHILVPIPMPKLRKLTRGYNQAELLAVYLGEALTIPVDTNLLLRAKNSKRQVQTQTRVERLLNQKNSFTTYGDVSGKIICLVDDVTTTGATLDEARKTLLASGASEVIAITLAH